MADQSSEKAVKTTSDYTIKIVMVGNSGVGKTAIMFRYTDDYYSPAFVSTVGIDFKVKTLNW